MRIGHVLATTLVLLCGGCASAPAPAGESLVCDVLEALEQNPPPEVDQPLLVDRAYQNHSASGEAFVCNGKTYNQPHEAQVEFFAVSVTPDRNYARVEISNGVKRGHEVQLFSGTTCVLHRANERWNPDACWLDWEF
jgi:hypothetical protein